MSEIIEKQKEISVIIDLSRERKLQNEINSNDAIRKSTCSKTPTLRGETNCMFTNNKHLNEITLKEIYVKLAVLTLKHQRETFCSMFLEKVVESFMTFLNISARDKSCCFQSKENVLGI